MFDTGGRMNAFGMARPRSSALVEAALFECIHRQRSDRERRGLQFSSLPAARGNRDFLQALVFLRIRRRRGSERGRNKAAIDSGATTRARECERNNMDIPPHDQSMDGAHHALVVRGGYARMRSGPQNAGCCFRAGSRSRERLPLAGRVGERRLKWPATRSRRPRIRASPVDLGGRT